MSKSTPLGKKLAANILAQQNAKRDAALAQALLNSEMDKKEFKAVSDFFAEVKEAVSTAIQQGAAFNDLKILVGARKTDKALLHASPVVSELLRPHSYNKSGLLALQKNGRFEAIAYEFESWAKSELLEPIWNYEHDGVGIYSWFSMTFKPASDLSNEAELNESSVRPEDLGAFVIKYVPSFEAEYLGPNGTTVKALSKASRFVTHEEALEIGNSLTRTFEVKNVGVHVTHCCSRHGCKYCDDDCPVAKNRLPQAYACEECTEETAELVHLLETGLAVLKNGVNASAHSRTVRKLELALQSVRVPSRSVDTGNN